MKLLEFEVKSPFRNLKGLKIKFDSNMSTYVIIGTNVLVRAMCWRR